MRPIRPVLLLIVAVMTLSAPSLRGVSPVGTVTFGANRTMTVCVDDPDNPSGTQQTVTLDVDGTLYDGFTMADGSCTTRAYAPFGPANHPIAVWALDSQGQAPTVLATGVLSEACAGFPLGSTVWGWCNDPNGYLYYAERQLKTRPLISNLVWAGMSTSHGGAIQQLYSSDRSFNLLNEHPGGAMQLSLWGGGYGAPLPPEAGTNGCNGWPASPTNPLMNLIQAQGPQCHWGHPVDDEVYWGPTVGVSTYTHTAENHLRHWSMPNFHVWTTAYVVTDHVQVNYRFINDTAWDFTLGGQEMPALHMAEGMNDRYFWGQGGTAYTEVAPHGAAMAGNLYVPGISPYPGDFGGANPMPWTGSWVSACDAANHCITVAPHDPPSLNGINLANLSSVVPANMLTLQGHFAMPRGTDKSWKIYVFPYPFWASPNGVNVLTRLQQLRGWL